MGYMAVIGECLLCKKFFSFNADKVPSFGGEPICSDCIRVVNKKRRKAGLDEWPILEGAYDPEEVP